MVWDSREKVPVQVIAHDYQVTSVCLDREGGQLYTGGLDNIIRRWDLRMPSVLPSLVLSGHGNTITGLSLNPEGTHLLSNGMDSNLFGEYVSSFSPAPLTTRSLVVVWDVRPFVVNESQRYEKKFEGARHGAEQVLLKCNWSPSHANCSSQVSCGSADRIVHIWDSSSTQPLYYLPGHKGSVNQVCRSALVLLIPLPRWSSTRLSPSSLRAGPTSRFSSGSWRNERGWGDMLVLVSFREKNSPSLFASISAL
jgi:Prp8 binding protein